MTLRAAKINYLLPAGLFLLVWAALAWASEVWVEKPFGEWTLEDLFKVTQDSPWAQTLPIRRPGISWNQAATAETRHMDRTPVRVPIYDQRGRVIGYRIIDRRPHATVQFQVDNVVVVQWASSLTMQQARARLGQLHKSLTEEQAAQLLQGQYAHHVLTVRGAYVQTALGNYKGPLEEALRESVYLKLKHHYQRVHPVWYVSAQEDPGAWYAKDPVVWFYFPREVAGEPVVGVEDEKVEFHWETPLDHLKATFDPRKMVRTGAPDL